MPAALLREWMAFEALEPFGAWRDNWHVAMLAMMYGNSKRDPRKRREFKISEFMWTDPATAQENADRAMLGALRALKTPGAPRG